MRPIKVKEPCFKFARQDIKIENTNGTLVEDGSVDKMMTFIITTWNFIVQFLFKRNIIFN
jgi:hypothetical protein